MGLGRMPGLRGIYNHITSSQSQLPRDSLPANPLVRPRVPQFENQIEMTSGRTEEATFVFLKTKVA